MAEPFVCEDELHEGNRLITDPYKRVEVREDHRWVRNLSRKFTRQTKKVCADCSDRRLLEIEGGAKPVRRSLLDLLPPRGEESA